MSWDREKERKAGKAMTIGTSIFGIVFLIIWTLIAPSFMKLFGLAGLAMMIYRLYVMIQLSNEDKKPNSQTEIDPWDRPAISDTPQHSTDPNGFCPYCGSAVQSEFQFCPKCGRRLN